MDAIKQKIETFVTELSQLVRDEAVKSVMGAFGAPSGTLSRTPTKRPHNGKRDPGELKELTDLLYGVIKSRPGQRIEQIAKGLGVTTKSLALPAKKLIAAKRVRTKGNRRATTYWVG